MSTLLVALLKKTIELHGVLRAGDRIAVAVSGGADSVALLRLLEKLQDDLGVTLCVAHFNHLLRGKESDRDEKFVETLARERRIEFVVGREDAAAAATRHNWNLEDAARRLRYGFLESLVANGRATRVATAHTADDQAETVLARIIRGSGIAGLSAIYPVRGSIIRPLLEMRRKDLRTYLDSIKQPWREDASNADTTRLRARVRQRLLPAMERSFSESIVNTLGGLAALARDDQRFWDTFVHERCNSLVQRGTSGAGASIRVKDLLWPMTNAASEDAKEFGPNPFRALTQRIIRQLFADISKERGELSRKHAEAVIQLAETGLSGHQIELPGGVRVRKELDRLAFTRARPANSPSADASIRPYAYELEFPARGSITIRVAELDKRFSLKVIDWPMGERETKRGGVILDAERLRPPVVLRSWEPGDAYIPLGHQQKRKLSRMLIAGRIAGAQRSLWPVLTSDGRIAWADRMPPAQEFSISEATRTGLWIIEDSG